MAAPYPPAGWLRPAPPQALEGADRFAGADATMLDFWRWTFSDLRDNTQRGVLAEFRVALALGRTETRRKAWDNYDVSSGSGLRVEVKASGYLQSWAQTKHSRLSFGRVIARTWDANTNEFGAEPEVRAGVFVFSVQTCTDPQRYDVLDLAVGVLRRRGRASARVRLQEREHRLGTQTRGAGVFQRTGGHCRACGTWRRHRVRSPD
jgi:hypothetical protein